MRTVEERLALLDEMLSEATARGLLMRNVDDEALDGRVVPMDGRPLVNFGSCSYLGLELHERMRAAVCEAVMRYGTQFSASRTYLSAPPYVELEERLGEMFGGEVLVVSSTSLGHVAALPVLIGSGDAAILDQQVHHSVHSAINHVRVQGSAVEVIRHSRLDALEEAIARFARTHERVWYLADGVYSMFADLAPLDELAQLLDRHPQLHLYMDDSHGVGWMGPHGRGPSLARLRGHERVVVAASLNKSFAASGAALVFPTAELKRRVRTLGGPLIFSGPLQPPMLGAALASAAIHLSPEIEQRQAALQERIELCTELLQEFCLPLANAEPTPIRYITLGLPRVAQDVVGRLLGDGFYVNLGMFPAVPMKQSGVRFTLTLHQQPDDIRALVDALARHVPRALAGEELQARSSADSGARRSLAQSPLPGAAHGGAMGSAATGEASASATSGRASGAASRYAGAAALRLEHHHSIDQLDELEWDRLLGARGSFTAAGLRFLERAFSRGGRPEDEWSFHYYVVRDPDGHALLCTFFTAALWKDDMLSSAEVSRLAELRRRDDPYYLTTRTFAMGSQLTEGEHLYLDRNRDWQGALALLIDEISAEALRENAETLILRDIDADDAALAEALREHGYVRVSMPDSLGVERVAADDETWLAGLSAKARVHQRRDVLPYDGRFEVEILGPGARIPSDGELVHLHELYRNVKERGLELNSFELPTSLWRDMLDHECWELMLLSLRTDTPSRERSAPVAFGAHFIGERHYAPMVVGLDYQYVRSHHSYRQALRQAMLRARELGADRLLLGMGAPFEKRRFGATVIRRCAYVQAADHYGQEVLTSLAADTLSA